MSKKIITNAVDLWTKIESCAKFEDYDKELLKALRTKLMLPSKGNMSELLTKYHITCEELLVALCSEIEPFSKMLSDLLEMFEKAGAQQSDNNIKINMQLSKNNALNFDLKFFTQSVMQTRIIHKSIHTAVIDNPWSVAYLFRPENSRYEIKLPKNTQTWLNDYFNKDIWPDTLPNFSETGFDKLDEQIRFFHRFIGQSIDKYKQYYDPAIGKHNSISKCCRAFDSQFWWSETDFWVGTLIHDICACIEIIKNGTDDDFVNRLENEIDDFIKGLQKSEAEIEEQIEEILNILNLPFWKKRYELYSAWICTQITKALEDTNIKFNVTDNTLSFSFTGSHIATCTGLNPPVEIWAELKTKFDSPVGKTRKAHIQPDYTLAVHPADNPLSSIAVVECKQYKRSNKKNFSEAVIDYAKGRANANIFLTSYGPVAKNVNSEFDAVINARSFLFSYIQPNSKECEKFQKSLHDSVIQKCSLGNNIYVGNSSCLPLYINLKWDKAPKDLDLLLYIKHQTEKSHLIQYFSKGSSDLPPFAQLDRDDTDGYGNETIVISNWYGTSYDIYVHNFSGESIDDTFPEITIYNESFRITKKLYKFESELEQIFHIDCSGIT